MYIFSTFKNNAQHPLTKIPQIHTDIDDPFLNNITKTGEGITYTEESLSQPLEFCHGIPPLSGKIGFRSRAERLTANQTYRWGVTVTPRTAELWNISLQYTFTRARIATTLGWTRISYLDGIGGHRRYATNETSYAAGFRWSASHVRVYCAYLPRLSIYDTNILNNLTSGWSSRRWGNRIPAAYLFARQWPKASPPPSLQRISKILRRL